MSDTFERAARFGLGLGLRALARLDASEWAERAGVRERIHDLTRRAAERVPKPTSSGSSSGATRCFDLTPTEDQSLMRDVVRRFAREAITPIAARADDAMRVPEDLFDLARELDWLGAGIDAHDGGEGERSVVTSALIYEALSTGDMGVALALLASTSAAYLIADHGDDEQKKRWLPDLMRGERMAIAIEPATLRGVRRGNGWTLRGRSALVPDIGAQRFLVHATFGGTAKLAIVERRALETHPVPTMGLRAARLGRLELRETPVEDVIEADLDLVRARSRIAWSALAVGQCQALLDYVIPFCNERIAFGEPISHKQSIAFLLADLAIELEGMRLMTWRAASRADLGHDYVREAFLAHLQCTEKAVWSATTGVQLLGGAGFIKDHPVERWYRHLRALGTIEGGVYA